MARLKGQVELAELDGHPFADEVRTSVDDCVILVGDVERNALHGVFASRRRARTVLVLDDDEALAAVTARQLARKGWNAEARIALDADTPHLAVIVIDYGLLMQLDETAKSMLRHRGFVVVSGALATEPRLRSLALGAMAYLTKPVDVDELSDILAASDRQ